MNTFNKIIGLSALLFLFSFKTLEAQEWVSLQKALDSAFAINNLELALDFAVKSRDCASQKYGSESKEYIKSLGDIGLIYRYMGRYKEAKPLYEQVMNLKKNAFGERHPNYAGAVNNYAGLLTDLNEFELAESLYLQALQIYDNSLGKEHYNYVNSKFSLGKLYQKYGDYSKAELIYQETIPQKKALLGDTHPDYAASLTNLAVLLKNTGNYEASQKAFEEIIQIQKKTLNELHPYYINTVVNYASLLSDIAKYSEAEVLFLKTIEGINQTSLQMHPNYIMALNGLAILYNNKQEYEKALPLYTESLQLREKLYGTKNAQYAKALDDLANLYFSMDNFIKAEELLLQAFAIRKEIFDKKHPEYAQSLKNLALLYLELNHYEKAAPFFYELADIRLIQVRDNFQYLSEKEQEKYWSIFKTEFDIFNTFVVKYAASDKELIGKMFNNHLITKGLLLNQNLKLRNDINNSNNTQIKTLYSQWIALKQKSSELQLLVSDDIEEQITLSERLEQQANNLEKELRMLSETFNDNISEKEANWQSIKMLLTTDEALIDFVSFNFYQNKHFTNDQFYVAVILTAEMQEPVLVELGTEDELSKGLRITLSNGNISDYVLDDALAGEVYKALWQPLTPYIANKKTVYYSPSGILSKVAFDMLPISANKRLFEEYDLNLVNNYRNFDTKKAFKPLAGNKITLFGGVNYNTDMAEMKSIASKFHKKESNTTQTAFNTLNKGKWVQTWQALEGSEMELLDLEKRFLSYNWEVQSFTKSDACEEAFKYAISDSSTILHIATHGFFFEDYNKLPAGDFFRSTAKTNGFKNPLHRSGLILSGANNAWRGLFNGNAIDDGILTSYEVALTDLSNIEMAVLSACETGVGEIKTGEGVYGLQRAFQIAGVDCLLMSLWTIPDYETIEFMNAFYSHWLENKNPQQAIKFAQKSMSSKHKPFYWAGFVLVR